MFGYRVNYTQVVALIIATAVLVLIIGAMRNSTLSLHAVVGSMVWATLGPHLVLLSLVACVFAFVGFHHFRGKLDSTVLVLSIAALIGSTYITTRIVTAAFNAGGSANPLHGLFLKSMDSGGPDEYVTFKTINNQVLNAAIYKPLQPSQPAPTLVYIHGGGFLTGSNTETDADLRWFAEQGWLVFSVDYRLFSPGKPTWDKAPQDVACAMAWVGANASSFGGNPELIALLGDSAGGNLALNVAYAAALDAELSDCGVVPVPKAVVVQYPAVDPLSIYEFGYPVPGFEPKMLVAGYIGGSPYDFPARVSAVSSSTYISSKAPSTLILAPKKDSIVPFSSVYGFAEEARLAGVSVEIVAIPFANHVYNQLASGSIGNQARLSITQRYLLENGLWPEVVQAE